MKRSPICAVVFGMALFLLGCSSAEKQSTAFFRDFNLGATVERMNVAHLQPQSGGSQMSSSHAEGSSYRRNFDLEYRIHEQTGERFDEAAFIARLKNEVAKQIGTNAQEHGSGGDDFYFNYAADESRGSVEVTGTRGQGDSYKLYCVVRELSGS